MRGVGKRLRARSAELELSDAEVARRAKIEQRTYSHYVNDKREPDYETLRRICDVLGLTPNDVLHYGDVTPASRRSDSLPSYSGALGPGLVEIGKTEFVSIARYDAALSAGPGAILDPHAEPLGYTLVEANWLATITRAKPEHLALLKVDGDSMSPTLEDEDWVLIDRTQKRVTRQGIYGIAVGEDTWIKRLMLDLAEKKVRIISDNARYREQLLAEDELQLIGRYLALIWRKSSA